MIFICFFMRREMSKRTKKKEKTKEKQKKRTKVSSIILYSYNVLIAKNN